MVDSLQRICVPTRPLLGPPSWLPRDCWDGASHWPTILIVGAVKSQRVIMVSERGQLASRRQIQRPKRGPGWLEFINHMPVIANPAGPSYCNSGRDGVELCTPAWYREDPEATWLAEGTLASQLGNEGTRQGKEARARYRSSQSADPCGNLGFPLSRPPWDLDPSRGMGLRAVVHADRHLLPARCGMSCCLLGVPWPSAPDSGGGWFGRIPWGRPAQYFPEQGASTRICRIFPLRRSGVRCAVGGSLSRVLGTVRLELRVRNETFVWYAFFQCWSPPRLRQRESPVLPADSALGPTHRGVGDRPAGWRQHCPVFPELGRTGWPSCDSTRAESKKVKPQFAR